MRGMAGVRSMLARGAAIAGAAILALPVGGCAEIAYDQLRLGQAPREYDRVLPSDASRRTHLGLCYLSADGMGRTDAILVLLGPDRSLAAKIAATGFERNWGTHVERGYRVRGEIDPQRIEARGAAPLDALRQIAGDLARYDGEKLARESHAWVAAGLVRLLQRFPNVSDVGVESRRLHDLLERVGGGGRATLTIDPAGVYHFEYVQGVVW